MPVEKTLPAAKPTVGGKVVQQTNVAVVKGQQQKTAAKKPDTSAPGASSAAKPGAGRRPLAAADESDDDSDEDDDEGEFDDSDSEDDDDIDDESDGNDLEDDDDSDDWWMNLCHHLPVYQCSASDYCNALFWHANWHFCWRCIGFGCTDQNWILPGIRWDIRPQPCSVIYISIY